MELNVTYKGSYCWSKEVEWWCVHVHKATFADHVKKLSLSDARIFKKEMMPTTQIIRGIIHDVCAAVGKLRGGRNCKENWELSIAWGFDHSVFL